MTKASRADVQKLVLLIAVAAYAFWVINTSQSQEEEVKEVTFITYYLVEIVEALLQTPQAADTRLQQTASKRVLLPRGHNIQ